MELSEAAAVFAALSVDTRVGLLRMLMTCRPNGLPSGDIAARLGLPASTASFHLAALERAGLTQSTRQGRQIIHAARIATVRNLLMFLTEACCEGRPELCGDIARLLSPLPEENHGMTPAFNVLFLCTHNSARSIMAEALLQSIGGQRFHGYSAGSDPSPDPNPEVIAKLRSLGHDTEGLRSKSWHEFTGPRAADGFCHYAMRRSGRAGLPRFRGRVGHRGMALARSDEIHRQFGGARGDAERTLRQPAPASRNIHLPAVRRVGSYGHEGTAR
jgi:protein-tyrosine-phosphatase/DNA-binding transcriptional ArsR family regulator